MDGEGCIDLCHRSARVRIINTYLPLLQEIRQHYNGKLFAPRVREGLRPYWVLTFLGTEAYRLLKEILPHLQEKKKQACIALSMEGVRVPASAEWRKAFNRLLKHHKRIVYAVTQDAA